MAKPAKTNIVHFACTLCGKCCQISDTGYNIDITAPEALRLADRLPLLLRIYVGPLGEQEVPAPLMTDRRLPSGQRVYYFFSFAPVVNERGGCPGLLESGACGVHADRPAICRIFPFRMGRGSEITDAPLITQHIRKLNFPCDIGEAAPIIAMNNRPVGEEYQPVVSQVEGMATGMRDLSDAMAALLGPRLDTVIEQILQAKLTKAMFPAMLAMDALLAANRIGEAEIKAFAAAQHPLLKKRLDNPEHLSAELRKAAGDALRRVEQRLG